MSDLGDVLAASGLTRSMWRVLWSLSDQPLLEPEIADSLMELAEAYHETPPDVDEISTAVTSCVNRGLVFRLTEADCAKDLRRWEHEEAECCSDAIYRSGALEFTAAGCHLYHQLMQSRLTEYDQAVWLRRRKLPGVLSAFSVYLEPLERKIDKVLGAQEFEGTRIRFLRTTGPCEIGPLWVDRYTQVPRGYRVDIVYAADPTS